MSILSRLRNITSKNANRNARRKRRVFSDGQTPPARRNLLIDPLEDRCLLALTFSLTALGALPGGDGSSVALGIDPGALLIGGASTVGGGAEHGFWRNPNTSGLKDVGVLSGDTNSKINDIVGTPTTSVFAVGRSGTSLVGEAATTGDHAILYAEDTTNPPGNLIDIGDLDGGSGFSEAFDININGKVVGISSKGAGSHGFQWEYQTPLIDMGDLPGGPDFSRAVSINSADVAVGASGVSVLDKTDVEIQTVTISGSPTGGTYTLSWEDDQSTVHTTTPLAHDADATAVQMALRQITGLGGVTVMSTGTSPNFTFTMTFDGTADLGNINQLTSTNNLTGGTPMIAHATTHEGGAGTMIDSLEAFIWTEGETITGLGSLETEFVAQYSEATDINDAGLIVGRSVTDAGMRAFILDPGDPETPGLVPIPPLALTNEAFAINNIGAVVGTSYGDGFQFGFVWSKERETINLNTTLDSSGSGWTVLDAFDIDEFGRIVGRAQFSIGEPQAVLLTPLNDPPVLNTIPAQSTDEGTELVFGVSASDADTADILTFSMSGEPAGATLIQTGPTTAEFHWTPDDSTVTPEQVTIIVTDDGAGYLADSQVVDITVNNVAPDAQMTGQTLGVPGQPLVFTLSTIDPSSVDQAANNTFDIDWNGDFVFDETVVGPSGLAQATHAFNSVQNVDVHVRATDKDLDTGSTFTLPVTITKFTLEPDPDTPAVTNLAIGGTDGDDAWFVSGSGTNVYFAITKENGVSVQQLESFTGVDGKILVYAQGGADNFVGIINYTAPIYFDGGAGDDSVVGGRADDTILGGSGSDIIHGSEGNDEISGQADNDILLGMSGNDTVTGDAGRDIIFGGLGADSLDGGDDDDLIVSGRSTYYFNTLSLLFLRQEWTSGNLFDDRVSHLSGAPGGFNGPANVIPGSTAIKDSSQDTLIGGSGQDWFLYRYFHDIINDTVDPQEEETNLDV